MNEAARATILIHYYRAMAGRADIWRTRMDATTNWAIGTTAGVVSLVLANALVPHYVVFLASFLTLILLRLEARRLTFYHLWQQRALALERHLVGAALSGDAEAARELPAEALRLELEGHLGTTIPTMSLLQAISRRLRRVYVYLLGAQVVAWVLKLMSGMKTPASFEQLASRAEIGPVPGVLTLSIVAVSVLIASVLAVARGGAGRRSAPSR